MPATLNEPIHELVVLFDVPTSKAFLKYVDGTGVQTSYTRNCLWYIHATLLTEECCIVPACLTLNFRNSNYSFSSSYIQRRYCSS
jgi:hypothetical protein